MGTDVYRGLIIGLLGMFAGAVASSACNGETGEDTSAGGASSGGGAGASTGQGGTCDWVGLGDADADCHGCAVESCASEAAACCASSGCHAIFDCAVANGCVGIDCHTALLCGPEIDSSGGAQSRSAELATSLTKCVNSECGASCMASGSGGSGGDGGGTSGGGGAGGSASGGSASGGSASGGAGGN